MPESSSVFATPNDSVFAGGFEAIKFGYIFEKSWGPVEKKKKKNDEWVVTDGNENPVFKINSCSTSAYSMREVIALLKERECSLLMIQNQVLTVRNRCDGYSTFTDDVETYEKKVLSVSKNSMVQDHMTLKVSVLNGTFLDNSASLEMEDRPVMLNDLLDKDLSLEDEDSPEHDKNAVLISDKLGKDISSEKRKAKEKQKAGEKKRRYIVVGSWLKKNFSIFERGSSTKIAQVRPLDNKDTEYAFMVDVFGNTNIALVVSLIAAIDCMKGHGKLNLAGKAAGLFFQVAAGAGVILTAVRELGNLFTS